MFDIITKQEYWQWVKAGITRPLEPSHALAARILARLRGRREYELKDVQDAFILSRLGREQGKRILEAGGGNSRVLRFLARRNECWLADKFEGLGQGPTRQSRLPGVQIVTDYLGSFNPALAAASFDFVFSISVMEHVPLEGLENFFKDCARLLKPGGRMLHAIDTYVYDAADCGNPGAAAFRQRLEAYLSFASRPDLGITLVQPPAITTDFAFSCRHATNPDPVLHKWHLARPDEKRVIAQVVSIKAEWVKQG